MSLFNGSYAALAQLAFRPSNALGLGLTYVRSFTNPNPSDTNAFPGIAGIGISSGTGSAFANQPFGGDASTTANQYGVEASLRLSPRFVVSGWAGYTQAEAAGAGTLTNPGASADIWNYAVTLALPDFGKKGNLLGFVFGMPPKVTENDIASRQDRDTSYHIEGFYRYRLTDNIEITPGAFAILNPQHNDDNKTLYVGTLRTTFRF